MVHTTLVARGVANLVVLALVGCVGENPDWDRGSTDTSGSPTDTDDTKAVPPGSPTDPSGSPADTADTHADPPTESSSTGASESSGAPEGPSGGMSTDPTNGEGPPCPEPKQVCDGACVEIWRDKKACGSECIDCTELHGNNAQCNDGECEPHGGNGDDD